MRFLGTLVSLTSLLAVGTLVWAFWPAPKADRPLGIGGDFSLIHETGAEASTATLFAGQPMLVTFGYTFCPDVCPTTLLDMVLAAEATAVEEAMVFVSVDPARDQPEVLAAYTDLFSPALHGFTGPAAQVEAVKADWAVYAARHDTDQFSDYLVDHTTLIFLTDQDHRVVETFRNGTPVPELAAAISARFSDPSPKP